MSPRLRVILDTNVFVSAARTPRGVCVQLLDAIYSGHCILVASEMLLDELKDVLHRPQFANWFAEGEIDEFVSSVRALAEIIDDPPASMIQRVRDPDDEYLVALARCGGIDALVSGDKDLLVIDEPEYPVWTPRRCLTELL